MMIFFLKKIFMWIKSDSYLWKKTREKTPDFAIGYHNKYAAFCPHASGLQEGLKQGPFVSSQHGALLTELMG